jgi:hypothetical protein
MSDPKFWDYWEGRDTIILSPQMVKASWGLEPRSIEFTNKALNVYYLARRNSETIMDLTHKKQMIDKLEDAARTGFSVTGWGDLETAFKKLARPGADRNQWTDNATDTYNSPTINKHWTGGAVVGPTSAVKFLIAMDSNLEELRQLLSSSSQEWERFTQIAKDPRRDWKMLGATLKRIGDIHSKTSKYLWLAPEKLPGLPQVKVALDKSKPFLKYVQEIYGIADEFLKYRMIGYSTSEAAQVAALKRALSFLPVFGEFYKNALDLIPALKIWFEGVIRAYQAKIDSVFTRL